MDLEREGYIQTRKGRGTFVAERAGDGTAQTVDSTIEILIDDLIRACTRAGMDDDDILAMVKSRIARCTRD